MPFSVAPVGRVPPAVQGEPVSPFLPSMPSHTLPVPLPDVNVVPPSLPHSLARRVSADLQGLRWVFGSRQWLSRSGTLCAFALYRRDQCHLFGHPLAV